ncbi:MAG: PASTA domain-containing protein [Planctomycetes bacterium]|nr:PASTA domain-containing protein [Planctomycetota bacterium]
MANNKNTVKNTAKSAARVGSVAQVAVPNLNGMTADDAAALLSIRQLVFQIVLTCGGVPQPRPKPDSRKVKNQCTPAGDMVDIGSLVSVVLTDP